MSNNKPTSYQLLKDTYGEISALRREINERFDKNEARIDVLEDFKSRGAVIIGLFSATIGGIIGATITWLRQRV